MWRKLWQLVPEAARNLRAAKLRTLLAMLGIVVGNAAVVALMTCSQLASLHAAAQFNSLGTELLAVDLMYTSADQAAGTPSGGLTQDLVDRMAAQITGIGVVAPYITLYQTSRYRQKEFSGPVLGVTEDFLAAAQLTLQKGRFITRYERAQPVCVIGAELAHQLAQLGLQDPRGEALLVGDNYFTIIGVLAPTLPNLFVYIELNQAVLIPLTSSTSLAKVNGISNLLIRLPSREHLNEVRDDLTYFLKQQVPAAETNVRDPQQLIQVMQQQQTTFHLLLVAIAAISLLVGGMGIMNIMLMMVLERRREIGIRLAVGALPADILRLFLAEALLLTLCGGWLGLVVGEIIARVWAAISQWQFYWLFSPMLLGTGLTLIIGIFAGWYPAWRASQLDPITALRME